MASYFPFVKSAFYRTKRKMSGPAASIVASLEKANSSMEETLPIHNPSANGGGLNRKTNSNLKGKDSRHWRENLDLREILSFVLFVILTVLIVGVGVMVWVLFFKFVVEPEGHHTRATWGGVWMLFTISFFYFRHFVRSKYDQHMNSVLDHAEIFVAMSLVMVFAVNIAFYIHVPSAVPLKDLGFMLIPEQAVDSKWRPLSDILTAFVPVTFVIQSLFMKRENRCKVISSFFRIATVCYFLRMLTVAVTSLPGPAPHCRLGSPDYFPPKNWIDIVTRVGPIYGNYNSCGDLIFSGHMAYTTSALLLYLRQLDRHFPHFSKLRWTLGITYLFVLAALCISGRKHYTVDVVLGVMISALVFFHFEHSWVPLCMQYPTGHLNSGSMVNGANGHQPLAYPYKRVSVDGLEEAVDEFDDGVNNGLYAFNSNNREVAKQNGVDSIC